MSIIKINNGLNEKLRLLPSKLKYSLGLVWIRGGTIVHFLKLRILGNFLSLVIWYLIVVIYPKTHL